MPDLVNVTRAELSKLAHRPASWVLLAAAVVLSQVFGYLIPYLAYRTGSAGPSTEGQTAQQLLAGTLPPQAVTNTIAAFPVFAGALALVLGALVTGSELTGGTLKTLFTQGPRRAVVLGGQLGALVVATGVGVLVLFATCVASSAGIALLEGQPLDWPSPAAIITGLGSGWLVVVMWSTLGSALGLLLRSVALPIGLGVVWILGIENLVAAVAASSLTALQPLRDALPGVASGGLVTAVLPTQSGPPPPGVRAVVSGEQGLLTVAAYAVGAALVVLAVSRRRDVVS